MRPRGKAGLKPRHSTCSRWVDDESVVKVGTCLGQAEAFPAGVRSPPLRGEADPNAACLAGKGLERTRGAFFSEGRTLCVRVARPDSSRGITFSPVRLR